eukprot:TRINITY_DN1172_c0_g2_i3.p1 TRINITY_DN1172_c0_g2~~TRINITY_DN1172_c0_g2_i3.p1  ORF type:complete len:106 (-),score=13.36 TRINITY_DN1172_c0_g2_i3:204-521(-)
MCIRDRNNSASMFDYDLFIGLNQTSDEALPAYPEGKAEKSFTKLKEAKPSLMERSCAIRRSIFSTTIRQNSHMTSQQSNRVFQTEIAQRRPNRATRTVRRNQSTV